MLCIYTYMYTAWNERNDFFKLSILRLKEAAESGFCGLENQCKLELAAYEGLYPSIPVHSQLPRNVHAHTYSVSLFPEELKRDYIPINAYGDGNCLFRFAVIKISKINVHYHGNHFFSHAYSTQRRPHTGIIAIPMYIKLVKGQFG